VGNHTGADADVGEGLELTKLELHLLFFLLVNLNLLMERFAFFDNGRQVSALFDKAIFSCSITVKIII
jgi:hypothetical protein